MAKHPLRIFSILLVLLTAAANSAVAETRLALVIGNGSYGGGIGPLANAPNDAALITKALQSAGFAVNTVIDADQKTMKRAFADFGQSLAAAGTDTVGLFYYAGHGVQVDGKNFLIPTGAAIESQADVEMEAVDANWVLKQMEYAGNRMNIIILDACRNNPLPATTRSAAEDGLARMDAPTGSFIAYSTAPGQAALDGSGSNSPYSEALAAAIESKQLPLELLFRQVRVAVMNETGNKQVPWDSSSLTGEFYFRTPSDGSAGDTTVATAAPAPAQVAAVEPSQPPVTRSQSLALPAPPGQPFTDCADCPEMVVIPAGRFQLGSATADGNHRENEGPQTEVTIPLPFALMTTEVTRDDYAAFVLQTKREPEKGCFIADGGDGVSDPNADFMRPGIEQGGRHPAVCVSWTDAQDYAAWLSQKTGRNYRLPSEQEFEYAARAGRNGSWPWGEEPFAKNGCRTANVFDASGKTKYPLVEDGMPCDDGFAQTAPVDALAANAFGLKGMIGNVWEWVADCYHPSYAGAPNDGTAWIEDGCSERGLRGSGYLNNAWQSRFAMRDKGGPNSREATLGFRLARDL
ncbi:SUMF1/EgtB/PvdO family nonheme iron enzyme [Dongia sp.]|uniref:SUMF1/EgtB/PvdO family nonheme iron enzyme n=1 Tax=Dongia sp. TaxID=1977262 RepID=UPI003750BC87